MSANTPCRCPRVGKGLPATWRVSARRCNHSAFNGHHWTPSEYSAVRCLACVGSWRTKAAYVAKLPDITETERGR